jgi:hypothetical protein
MDFWWIVCYREISFWKGFHKSWCGDCAILVEKTDMTFVESNRISLLEIKATSMIM